MKSIILASHHAFRMVWFERTISFTQRKCNNLLCYILSGLYFIIGSFILICSYIVHSSILFILATTYDNQSRVILVLLFLFLILTYYPSYSREVTYYSWLTTVRAFPLSWLTPIRALFSYFSLFLSIYLSYPYSYGLMLLFISIYIFGPPL